MPRPRVEDRGFSSLKLKRKRNMAYCYCFGKPWYFGPWDQESDKPSAEAEIAFLRQVQQWATNPDGAAKGIADDRRMSVANGGPLFISLWADWRAAPGTFCPVNGQMDTCERLLFMGPVAEGMNHSHTTISEFTLPAFSDWQERLCAKRRRAAVVRQGHGEETYHDDPEVFPVGSSERAGEFRALRDVEAHCSATEVAGQGE